ncbi:YceI family protein [Rhodococcus gannanensis]|uniref:YceI family protein n=1 Tax=Rhodococcus gannanensis TaxID=1960308 RepID=A0ABW4P6G2_9NOCA
MRKRVLWIIGAVLAVAVIAVGVGPWAYAKFFHGDQPDALGLSGAATGGSGSLDGNWTVAPESAAGYEVWETLNGQRVFVRGQTQDVTGTATVEDSTLSAGVVEVDVASIATDSERRDAMFDMMIMNTGSFPTATFEVTEPVDLSVVPEDGSTVSVPVSGKLTLHGQTRDVTTNFDIRRSGENIETAGAVDVAWTDYGVQKPTTFPNIVVEDAGQVQFSIVLGKS